MLPLILRALTALLLLSTPILPAAFGQAAPKPATSAAGTAAEDTITLTPFEVKADASDTYEATNPNSVTGTNTALNKTPLDAQGSEPRVFRRSQPRRRSHSQCPSPRPADAGSRHQ